MKRTYLMTPGPSPVPAFVREGMAREIMHHRTDEFQAILQQAHEGLKKVFCTSNPVLMLASSGTGAMEAAVTNLFSPKDKVITVNGGKFGERWTEIAKAHGLEAIELKIEWGKGPSPDEIARLIDANPTVKGVLATLCETSTATVYDIEGIGTVAKAKNVLFVVDAISGLGQDKLLTDDWGVDVVVSGSQKGFMLPPGLAFISLSKKAQAALTQGTCPKFYFNLSKALKSYEKNDTPWTPAVSLIVGLNEALRCLAQEDNEARWRRFQKMARATQEAAKALGLTVFSASPSSSVTAIVVPANVKSGDIVKTMRKKYGISIAEGQDHVKEKIFRIAHMGWINEQDLMMCFSLLEKVLKELGHTFTAGASLARLQEVIYG